MQKYSRKAIITAGITIAVILVLLITFFFRTDFSVLNPFSSSKLNILVTGYDSSINGPPRADTIILASIDLKTKGVGILSIPRDTRVEIPGRGMNRINASHAFGGIELTVKTLESFLDIPIDYYLETDFKGFSGIIDAIGGVEINIKEPLRYVDRAGGLNINLPAGRQVLDGEKALQYVRYREEIKGDIGRVERQQRFIKALVERVMNPNIVMKLPAIYKEVRKSVNTNIPFKDITPFIHLLKDMKLHQLKTVMVPGEPKYINGASYWIAEEHELKILVNNLIRSKEYIKNSEYQISLSNGNGERGVAGELADELTKYGFRISSVGNADHFNYQETIIRYHVPRNRKLALGVRELIGGVVELKEYKNGQGEDKMEIIIGADYLQERELIE